MKLFVNAKIIFENEIKSACVLTDKDKIIKVAEHIDAPNAKRIDCGGLYLSPGFADIHVHGGGGFSAMSENEDEIIKMCRAHAIRGTTSIVPTTLASPVNRLQKAIKTISLAKEKCAYANILGVHLEGPFLSPKKSGAQSPENIIVPNEKNISELLDFSKNVLMIGAAPEIDGGMLVGREAAKRNIVASVAHSDASFETAEEALKNGYSDITHIFSACSAMHKEGIFRQVGVAEAGLALDGYTAQFIGDLKHLPAGAVKLIYKCKGANKGYLISDGLEFSASDIKQGETVTQENGMKAVFEDGVMLLEDKSCLAGSASSLNLMVKNMLLCGIPLTEAVKMASLTPLTVLGFDKNKGKIKEGYDADIILFDNEINVKKVFVTGKEIS
ncbi:MAG: amidohydrolase family protein [Oscillospiraceae bacterium]|nr:amidohydrolase family protein [Oscillospiraceae bacterium]